jgi:hypothetical protein
MSGGVLSVLHDIAGAERYADTEISDGQKMRKAGDSVYGHFVFGTVFLAYGDRTADGRSTLGDRYYRIGFPERRTVSAVLCRGSLYRSEEE